MSGAAIIPEVYRQHLEEFHAAWLQWRAHLDSPEMTPADLSEWEQNLLSHLDGLLVPKEAAIDFLRQELASEDPSIIFSAAHLLLQLRLPEAAADVIKALASAEEDEVIDLLRDACCYGSIRLILDDLRRLAAGDSPALALAAEEILAFHNQWDRRNSRWREFVGHESAAVRLAAWRLAAIAGAAEAQAASA